MTYYKQCAKTQKNRWSCCVDGIINVAKVNAVLYVLKWQ